MSLQKSLIFAHAADTNHAFQYEDAEVISVDARKGERLIREAWYSGSLDRHITLFPACKVIQRRARSRKRDNPGDNTPTQRQTEAVMVDPNQCNNVQRYQTRNYVRAGDDTPSPN